MQNSAVKIVADFDKITENIKEIGEDIKNNEFSDDEKSEIRDELLDLIKKMEEVRDNFRKDRKEANK